MDKLGCPACYWCQPLFSDMRKYRRNTNINGVLTLPNMSLNYWILIKYSNKRQPAIFPSDDGETDIEALKSFIKSYTVCCRICCIKNVDSGESNLRANSFPDVIIELRSLSISDFGEGCRALQSIYLRLSDTIHNPQFCRNVCLYTSSEHEVCFVYRMISVRFWSNIWTARRRKSTQFEPYMKGNPFGWGLFTPNLHCSDRNLLIVYCNMFLVLCEVGRFT